MKIIAWLAAILIGFGGATSGVLWQRPTHRTHTCKPAIPGGAHPKCAFRPNYRPIPR